MSTPPEKTAEQEAKSIALLACPFCGSPAEKHYGRRSIVIRCTKCKAQTEDQYYNAWPDKPQKLWNKRACDHKWDYEPKGFCSGVKTRTCKVCGAVETATTPY